MSNKITKWYVATLIVQCRVANEPPSTCDEQIRLIHAVDADHAYEKALWLGKQEEITYLNEYGETVCWEFIGLENLEELEGRLRDGVEIKSRLMDCGATFVKTTPKVELSVFRARHNPHSSEYRGSD
jgi:hypothetical protein